LLRTTNSGNNVCVGDFKWWEFQMQDSMLIAQEAQTLLRVLVRLDRSQKQNLIDAIDLALNQQLTPSQVLPGVAVQAV
jgi:hypothetical protein